MRADAVSSVVSRGTRLMAEPPSGFRRASPRAQRWVLAVCLFALQWLLSAVAYAQTQQPWLSNRRQGQGPGIRTGNLELHPGVAAEAGYDSNFFQAAGADPNPLLSEPIIPVARLRLTPSLTLSTLGPERRAEDGENAAPPKAEFDLLSSVSIDKLFALEAEDEEAASPTLISGDLLAEVEIGPREPFGAAIGGRFTRFEYPSNDPTLVGAAFDRNRYGGHLDFRWRPGAGVLTWSLGYVGAVTQYDNADFALDRAEHGFRTQGRYRFFPRTALVYEGYYGFVSQLHQASRLADASPISSQLGINGLISPRLSLLLMGGFKAMFFEPTESGALDDFDGLVGRAEATWFVGAAPDEGAEGPEDRGLSRLRLGVQRDVLPGGIGNFYELNRAFVEAAVVVGGVVMITGRAGFSLISHATPRGDGGQPLTADGGGLTEQRPDAGLFVEYRIVPTVGLFANTEFTASQPDNYVVVDQATFAQDNLSFSRFTALFGARWFL